MPELPEVEALRRRLLPGVVGRRVVRVRLIRPGVVTGRREPQALLRGAAIADIHRCGKQLAIVAEGAPHPALCIHLGMTGSLRIADAAAAALPRPSRSNGIRRRRAAPTAPQPPSTPVELGRPRVHHVHIVWIFDDGTRLFFRDPRRFGGVWTYPSVDALAAARWHHLGPDALTIRPAELARRLCCTRRPIKAALLDQTILAGLGNIYVDELLHAARIHPLTPANALHPDSPRRLVERLRRLLSRAIEAGGSTFRDYVSSNGEPGNFQQRHRVYGRAGEPCTRCRLPLQDLRIIGRQTVFCAACQANPDR